MITRCGGARQRACRAPHGGRGWSRWTPSAVRNARPGGSTLVTGMTFLVRSCDPDRRDITMHMLLAVAPVVVVLLLFERPVHAYLDPGSGSMLLQVLLGGFAAVGVVGRLYWHRLTAAVRSLTAAVRRKKGPQEPR